MIEKVPLVAERVRRISGSFSFIEHRFLRGGFWQNLSHEELLLYFFLTLAGDRNGVSFYSYDKICALLKVHLDDYILARNGLIEKDLIAFDGHLFQVLSLPESPLRQPQRLLKTQDDMLEKDPATVHRAVCDGFGLDPDKATRSRQR
ncbi:MAG: helix-turn-helix domain-containing protein [Deltaproteobacteria bacterium]|nr:helix-turn-helix domain-containing protein [Deltaproteobacteria bacterium]